jgi:hypothetical protein
LARHRQRFAFPDAFNELVKPIRRWFEKKAGKNSPAGKLVDNTREVRVRVDSWDSPTELLFLVLLTTQPTPSELLEWQKEVDALASKIEHGAYPEPEFRVVSLQDVSAAEYLAADRLDWDGLSDAD